MTHPTKEYSTSIAIIGRPSVVIFLAFFIAKLTGYIDWSWWLVFLPLYFWVAVSLGALALGALIYLLGLAAIVTLDFPSRLRRRKRQRESRRRQRERRALADTRLKRAREESATYNITNPPNFR